MGPAVLAALSRHNTDDRSWRVLSAPFVQDGGVVGATYNVLTALVVLALAEWAWGTLTTLVLWLLAAWAPVGAVAGLVGYHVSAANEHAYSAGSSGATYFVAGSLCALAVIRSDARARWTALAAPAIAVAMWLVVHDGHGVLFVEGTVAGLLVAAAAACSPALVTRGMPVTR